MLSMKYKYKNTFSWDLPSDSIVTKCAFQVTLVFPEVRGCTVDVGVRLIEWYNFASYFTVRMSANLFPK